MLVDSLNLSTKFIKNELGDPINYKTYIHNADKTNNISEIPTRYQDKKRILKDRDSINSFRIYDTNLKKRTNPSDIYQNEIMKQKGKENNINENPQKDEKKLEDNMYANNEINCEKEKEMSFKNALDNKNNSDEKEVQLQEKKEEGKEEPK